jgi:hypothetical protein
VRYLMTTNGGGPAPDKQLHEDMGKLVAEMIEKGIVVATGGLDPKGTHVSASGGKVTLTDGPYTEAKETIVSFALVDVDSQEQLMELTQRFWALVKDGEGDIRRVYGPGE